MSFLEFFRRVFAQMWVGMSNINVPLLDIPVTRFLIGMFVVGVAIGILNPLLGIGGGIVDAFVAGAHRSQARAESRASRRVARNNMEARRQYALNRARARDAERNLHDVSMWV